MKFETFAYLMSLFIYEYKLLNLTTHGKWSYFSYINKI